MMNESKIFSFDLKGDLFRLLFWVAVSTLVALLLFQLLMQPTLSDFAVMTAFLAITAMVSIVLGYGILKAKWFPRSPSLRWSLLSTYLLSSSLTLICIWLTARLMFVSDHDLLLGTILLLFASGIAVALGFFFAQSLMERISTLRDAARTVSEGDLTVRVPVTGTDELAELSTVFNSMVNQLEKASAQQRELDALRKDLFAWLGHDLQTPLTSIRALVEALADGLVDEEEVRQRYLRTAQSDIQALSSLIDDLFQMAQLDAGGIQMEVEQNSIKDLISDILERFSQQALELEVHLIGTVQDGIDPVRMDARQVGRVLTNLISNSLHHSTCGGTIQVDATREGNQVQVTVSDDGQGMTEEDLPFIFDRFYRGDKSRGRVGGGSGLGLTIAKGLVEAHCGRIWVERVPERGTRFTFTLPQ
jgi:signal transduction histidine kinase